MFTTKQIQKYTDLRINQIVVVIKNGNTIYKNEIKSHKALLALLIDGWTAIPF